MDQQHQQQAPEQHYAGLDVSLDDTSVCVLDAKGTVVWRGKCASTPEAIRDTLAKHAPALVRVGLETGQLSNWLTHGLRGIRLPVVCLDARHAKAVLKLQVNKTDANDALGLAQIVRTGWYREVAIKGMDAQTLRLLLVARSQLVSQRRAIANTVRGLLKAFGLKVAAGSKGLFAPRVREAAEGNDALLAIVEPMLLAWQALRERIEVLNRQVLARAKADETTKRLMSVPGVGAVVALAYTAVIDDPARFKRSSSVGAYLGLTPSRSDPSRRAKPRRRLRGAAPVRRGGPDGPHLAPRRRAAQVLPVRGRDRAAPTPPEILRAEGVGPRPGPALRLAPGQGRRRAQARGRDALRLEERRGVPLARAARARRAGGRGMTRRRAIGSVLSPEDHEIRPA